MPTGSSEPSPVECCQSHPLLEDVRCQRLRGHPGPHGAEIETASAEVYLEWAEEVDEEDPGAGG